jgi:hypothetical protein
VAANRELRDPSSGVTVGMIFIDICIKEPRKDGSLPCRLVTMRPGCNEYAVTPLVGHNSLAWATKKSFYEQRTLSTVPIVELLGMAN